MSQKFNDASNVLVGDLKKTPLFKDCPDHLLTELAASCERRIHNVGEKLEYKIALAKKCFFLIEQGSFVVTKETDLPLKQSSYPIKHDKDPLRPHKKFVLCFRGDHKSEFIPKNVANLASPLLGEFAFNTEMSTEVSETYCIEKNSSVIAIPFDSFRILAGKYEKVYEGMFHAMVAKLGFDRKFKEAIQLFSTPEKSACVPQMLCLLAHDLGLDHLNKDGEPDPFGPRIRGKITTELLSAYISEMPKSVEPKMDALTEQGLIRYNKDGDIRISDWNTLNAHVRNIKAVNEKSGQPSRKSGNGKTRKAGKGTADKDGRRKNAHGGSTT